jgi:hypothetical protein
MLKKSSNSSQSSEAGVTAYRCGMRQHISHSTLLFPRTPAPVSPTTAAAGLSADDRDHGQICVTKDCLSSLPHARPQVVHLNDAGRLDGLANRCRHSGKRLVQFAAYSEGLFNNINSVPNWPMIV